MKLPILMCAEKSEIYKKVDHPTDGDNFVKTQPIFKIFSLLERGVNCKQNPFNISHHT